MIGTSAFSLTKQFSNLLGPPKLLFSKCSQRRNNDPLLVSIQTNINISLCNGYRNIYMVIDIMNIHSPVSFFEEKPSTLLGRSLSWTFTGELFQTYRIFYNHLSKLFSTLLCTTNLLTKTVHKGIFLPFYLSYIVNFSSYGMSLHLFFL